MQAAPLRPELTKPQAGILPDGVRSGCNGAGLGYDVELCHGRSGTLEGDASSGTKTPPLGKGASVVLRPQKVPVIGTTRSVRPANPFAANSRWDQPIRRRIPRRWHRFDCRC